MTTLSPTTRAIMLLTVAFPGEAEADRRDKPLSPAEWGSFAEWLKVKGLRPERLMDESPVALLDGFAHKPINAERITALLGRNERLDTLWERWAQAGLWVMTRADKDYPTRLKQRLGQGSPAVLFGCGKRPLLSEGGLAVVGSRKASPEDLAYSRQLGMLASQEGASIVSGGARGIDEAAMLGALEKEGTAIGVLANALLQVSASPRYSSYLKRDLVLVSATHPEAGFNIGNAMARNKYIYCLADAAVVVHSGKTGGTWSGANENLKHSQWNVPLWIKETSDPEAGNELLLKNPRARKMPPDLTNFNWAGLFAPPPAETTEPQPRQASFPLSDEP